MDIELFDPDIIKPKQLKYSLWRFYDKNDNLLYVSQKPNPALLMPKTWWFNTHHVTIEHFSSYDDLLNAKAVAVDSENPKWNKFGRRPDGI
jgi:hypothetical protein